MKAAQHRRRPAMSRTGALFLIASLVVAAGVLHGTAGDASGALAAAQHEPWVISPRRAAVPNPVPQTDQAVAKGREVYKAECATCHGDTGQNDGPGVKKIAAEMKQALLLTDPQVHEQSDGSLFWKITEGRGKMPSTENELSEEERWQLVHFVRTFAHR
jgi:mono/diheme cytochrome c family protein